MVGSIVHTTHQPAPPWPVAYRWRWHGLVCASIVLPTATLACTHRHLIFPSAPSQRSATGSSGIGARPLLPLLLYGSLDHSMTNATLHLFYLTKQPGCCLRFGGSRGMVYKGVERGVNETQDHVDCWTTRMPWNTLLHGRRVHKCKFDHITYTYRKHCTSCKMLVRHRLAEGSHHVNPQVHTFRAAMLRPRAKSMSNMQASRLL